MDSFQSRQVGAKHLVHTFCHEKYIYPDASPLRVDGGFPFHNLDLFGGEAEEFVDEVVDLAVGGVDLALEYIFLLGFVWTGSRFGK